MLSLKPTTAVTHWIPSWGFNMASHQVSPFWLMISAWIMWSLSLIGMFSLAVVSPFQRGGWSDVRFNRSWKRFVFFLWTTSAGHFFTDMRFFTLKGSPATQPSCYPPHLSLLCITSSAETNCGLLLCLPTVQFLEGAGGNKTHYIAVCIGTSRLRSARERNLGCSPAWLAVAVKCFPVWAHRSHLFGQVHRLKWLPVWKFSLSPSLCLFSAPVPVLPCLWLPHKIISICLS